MNKFLELFKGALVFCLVFFVPIFFAIILQTNNVFELNKMVLFRVLALLAVLLLYVSTAKNPSPEHSGSPLDRGE